MRLFYTTSDFVYKGRPRQGIPFVCFEDMDLVKPASDFLLWVALENPRIGSPATWKSYAEAIYDYFAWLEANSLSWDALPLRSKDVDEISNIALYRNWSLDVLDSRSGKRAMQPATVRKRLSQIMRFYEWAAARNRIAGVPWDVVMVSRAEGRSLGSVIRESTLPKVPRHAIRFLTIDQCRVAYFSRIVAATLSG